MSFEVTNDNNGLFAPAGQPAISTGGTLTYTPAADANGEATVTVKAKDTGGAAGGGIDTSAKQTFEVTVSAVNDAPTNSVPSAGQSTEKDTPLVLSGANQISTADKDAGNSDEVREDLDVTNGTLTLGGTAGLTFTTGDGTDDEAMSFTGAITNVNAALDGLSFELDTDYSGPATLTITTDDQGKTGFGGALSDTDTVTIEVTGANDPPKATADTKTVAEDSDATAIDVLANDEQGPENEKSAQTLNVGRIASNPTYGTASVITDQGPDKSKISYKPSADYNGTDAFTYEVCDDGTTNNASDPECATGTVKLTVTEVNDAPKGANDTKTTPENTPLVFPAGDLTRNDAEGPENESVQALTVTEVKNPAKGTVSLDKDKGEITFTPERAYNGKASFEYTVCDDGKTDGRDDPKCSTRTATVDVEVSPVNTGPTPDDGTKTMNEDGEPLTVDLRELASDVETSDDNLTYTIVSGPGSEKGTLSAGSDPGVFTFTPKPNFNGQASFTYKVEDRGDPDNCGAPGESCGAPKSDEGVVTITVTPAPDKPVADDKALTIDEDPDAPGEVTLSASDGDGDGLTYTVVEGPEHGTLSGGTGANRTYTPNPNFSGTDSFTYKANDGSSDGNVATVTITVRSVSDPPVADDQSVTIDEGAPKDIALKASDVDGDNLTYRVAGAPEHGDLSGSGPNLKYTPGQGYTGSDSFTFEVGDGKGGTDTAEVRIKVEDTTALTVTIVSPQDGATRVGRSANVEATFSEGMSPDTITTANVKLVKTNPTTTTGGGGSGVAGGGKGRPAAALIEAMVRLRCQRQKGDPRPEAQPRAWNLHGHDSRRDKRGQRREG